jgi:integrase
VEAFAAAFGGNRLTQITGDDIKDWIETDLGYDNPHTFNNWRKHIRTFFDHYRKQIHQNPCDDIRTRNDDTEHVGILTPAQTAKLFSYALTENRRHLIGRLALEAFAGLRFASAYRLEKADINFKDLGLLLPKHKIKTKRRHYIDGLPENLWSWLEVTSNACWSLTPAEYMKEKSQLFSDAKGCCGLGTTVMPLRIKGSAIGPSPRRRLRRSPSKQQADHAAGLGTIPPAA